MKLLLHLRHRNYLKVDKQLNQALERINELWGAKPKTAKSDELDVLMLLVEKYENEHHAIPPSDAVQTIKFLMEQNNMSRKDLEPYLGSSGGRRGVFKSQVELSIICSPMAWLRENM